MPYLINNAGRVAELFGQHLNIRDRHAERFVGLDAEAQHIVAVTCRALLLEPCERCLNLGFHLSIMLLTLYLFQI